MIVVSLTDIHGSSLMLKKMRDILSKADIALLTGDITNFGKEAETRKVLDPVIHNARKVFAVSGNCDYQEVSTCLSAQNVNLHGNCEVHNGWGFIGLGGSLITPFQTPNELTEHEIEIALMQGYSKIPAGLPMVLVSHQPPIKTKCDRIASGDHVGSIAVRDFIVKYQPKICFTGHIHESIGVDTIGKTHVINPGMLSRGGYAYAEINNDVEIIEIRKISY